MYIHLCTYTHIHARTHTHIYAQHSCVYFLLHILYVQTSDSGDTDKPAKKDDIHAPPKNIGDLHLQEKVI